MPRVTRAVEKEVSMLFPPEATTRDMASNSKIYRKKNPETAYMISFFTVFPSIFILKMLRG